MYGIRGRQLEWCRSYLNGRSQQVLANNHRSTALSVCCGVPQGSVLGPLFFILYVNDMLEALGNVNVQLYADDTVLSVSGANLREVESCLQHNLNRFQSWCEGMV